MIDQLLKKLTCYFNTVSFEVSYCKQIETVQIERDLMSRQLANQWDENEFLIKENDTLKAENSALKDEL